MAGKLRILRMTRMGTGIARSPKSEVGGPKFEVGWPKTGRNGFHPVFLLFPVFLLAAIFCRSKVRKIPFA